jgi:hypothetical protein
MEGNISLSDQISAHVYYLKGLNKFTKISTLLKYRIHILRKDYPVEASLRNGDKLLLRNGLEVLIHGGRNDWFEYDTDNDIATLSMPSDLTSFILYK